MIRKTSSHLLPNGSDYPLFDIAKLIEKILSTGWDIHAVIPTDKGTIIIYQKYFTSEEEYLEELIAEI